MADKSLHLLNGVGQRFSSGDFVDKIFWAICSSTLMFGVQELRDISKTVSELNEKMAVVVTQVAYHEKRLDLLESLEVSRHSSEKNK